MKDSSASGSTRGPAASSMRSRHLPWPGWPKTLPSATSGPRTERPRVRCQPDRVPQRLGRRPLPDLGWPHRKWGHRLLHRRHAIVRQDRSGPRNRCPPGRGIGRRTPCNQRATSPRASAGGRRTRSPGASGPIDPIPKLTVRAIIVSLWDTRGMNASRAENLAALSQVTWRARSAAVMDCKTVGSVFPNLIVGNVADAFVRLVGGAADP
jgi:hypothetical protein